MVGHLNLQGMDENFETKCKNWERFLDSPDSGLPPSPSPPLFALSPRIPEGERSPTISSVNPAAATRSREGKLIPYFVLNSPAMDPRPRMHPVFFGERIEVKCESAQEIRCHSVVNYDSDKHYRVCVYYQTMPTVTSYSETVITTPNCTWRNYKSQLIIEPRQKPLRFESTTIIFPKYAKNIYRTTLNYNAGSNRRHFMSSVQLQTVGKVNPCLIYTEDL
ncbi:refilin-A [Carcharodon carcharias]|uniref:refilin-A n=1 Tax=Carcharodon carcharias TaxID=13397 RepID=UPI001B7DEFC8|nr:refilin-A [Carcharodon carcharias]